MGSHLPPATLSVLEQQPTLPAPAQQLRVLLAEDQPINQRVVVRILEKRGHSLMDVGNGREALEALVSQSFDVVLMDVQMPDMDGIEATRVIRLQERGTARHQPIVVLTAYAIKGDRERFLAEGFDGYLSKPIASSALYETIERLVSSPAPLSIAWPDKPALAAFAPGPLNAAWDQAAALARVDNDTPFLKELIRIFLNISSNFLAELEAAVTRRDAAAIARVAHTLKGNVAMLCATPTLEQTLLVENKAIKADLDGIEADFAELKRRLIDLQAALETFAC